MQIENGSVLLLLDFLRRAILTCPPSQNNNDDAEQERMTIPWREHRVLGLTTCCFDLSVVEMFLPLVLGTGVCIFLYTYADI